MNSERMSNLVKNAKKGDATSYVKLCENYQIVLYNSAYKLLKNDTDVTDCLQETELKGWKKIHTLKNNSAFNTWIFKIMINCAKDILKKRIDTVELEENSFAVNDDLTKIDWEQIFDKLPDKYKISIILYYYSGFSTEEISVQLDISKNTVKTRLARGREKLRLLLEVE